LSTICDADLICMLKAGWLAGQGTHDELIGQGGLDACLCSHELAA
jgi:ABC-type transport system involved in Fe-S cluster assembly fused permease/ATPase subunit